MDEEVITMKLYLLQLVCVLISVFTLSAPQNESIIYGISSRGYINGYDVTNGDPQGMFGYAYAQTGLA